jgi:phenylalanyl-tRNA synthetase beta chain
MARILQLTGIADPEWKVTTTNNIEECMVLDAGEKTAITMGSISQNLLKRFDINQPVYYANIKWEVLLAEQSREGVKYKELPKQLPVLRDLAMVVPKAMPFGSIKKTIKKMNIEKLRDVQLFDIFESEKIGHDKKSFAVSFSFLDEQKTLTDGEIDGMMRNLMKTLSEELQVEIRK